MESKSSDKNHETLAIFSTLKEVEVVTSTVVESLLAFIARRRLQSKSSNWSLVSKLVHPKRVASMGEEESINELVKVDTALQLLISQKTSTSDCFTDVESIQNWLGKLESSIQDLEEGIENLFRCCRCPLFPKAQAQSIKLYFEGPRQTKPSSLRRPSSLPRQKTRGNGVGPSIKPKTHASPFNPKYMSVAMRWGSPEQSKREGKPFPRRVQKRKGKITPHVMLSLSFSARSSRHKRRLLPNEKYGSPGPIIAEGGWSFSLTSGRSRHIHKNVYRNKS